MDAGSLQQAEGGSKFWVLRAVVLSSLAAHLALVLLSEIRRREGFGWRRGILRLAWKVTNWAPVYVLGELYFQPKGDKLLVMFWLPFILLHCARPDNISAYTMEDNKLSRSPVISVIVGATYLSWNIFTDSTAGMLRPAYGIMFSLGILKCVESMVALCLGDMGRIRERDSCEKKLPSRYRVEGESTLELKDEEALLVAHKLFHICKCAFTDYPVSVDLRDDLAKSMLVRERTNLRKVVEMELSLMYDIMYTKAAVIHTWPGYAIRVASPPLTAAALVLFYLHNTEDHKIDIYITYFLLVTTFFLDVIWLVRALVSTWTHSFLKARPQCSGWFSHELLCRGRWRQLRSFVMSLDYLSLWICPKKPKSYRMWSSTFGRLSFLSECSGKNRSLPRRLKKIFTTDPDLWWVLASSLIPFAQMAPRASFVDTDGRVEEHPDCRHGYAGYTCDQVPPSDYYKQDSHEGMGFAPEFQEVILTWHIATDIFLHDSNTAATVPGKAIEAIKAMSEYMMFLVAERPNMLPGRKFSSQYKDTCKALEEIRKTDRKTNKEELARWMREHKDLLKGPILREGTQLAEVLLRLQRGEQYRDGTTKEFADTKKRFAYWIPALKSLCPESPTREPLKAMLEAWKRMLIYASIRCSREAHAEQLSHGGELTTVIWIMREHADTSDISEFFPLMQ